MSSPLDSFMESNTVAVECPECQTCAGHGRSITGLADGKFAKVHTNHVDRVTKIAATKGFAVAAVRPVGLTEPNATWVEITKIATPATGT